MYSPWIVLSFKLNLNQYYCHVPGHYKRIKVLEISFPQLAASEICNSSGSISDTKIHVPVFSDVFTD